MWLLDMLERRRKLKERGVLGMNRRNHAYIGRYNDRSLYPVVDDKVTSKKMAIAAGVAVPKLLHIIESIHELALYRSELEKLTEFVLKPAKGSGGKGIMVITGRDDKGWIKASGGRVTYSDLERHISNSLGGLYSLGGKSDVVMIEGLIKADPVFDRFSFEGVPDIRTIVFQGYPVMAMMRLATRRSDGKANLHQGAVGVGLDLATGRSLKAVQFGRPVVKHPDTGHAFDDLKVPHWRRLLELSSACYDMTGLGYLGVDIVLDRDHGPLILELNARPGLAIQMANGQGLLPRLQTVEGIPRHHPSVAERVDFSQTTFAQYRTVSHVHTDSVQPELPG
ncbi:alpha-L-glutamate ligase-like protein [Parendozoicomonas haliclonae]|uniref:Ribosomal protein S6-L-glutamate ligase n=1 Tax=Parendozoicomonas haliclonae TaxID=1960125 RepID=A0A1X7ALR1_9GAMM|nr:alpha-L-glutamate ligase-like protein [Parendozoicomonas haliclonae]SMA48659.1 Ribosomal protein S6-L-glutamate ligase [Parendozoicomonas haliclonae]